MRKKQFFILYYFKTYPTFDVLGDRFAMDRSKACTNAHNLTPVLCRALDKAGVLPKRKFNSVAEMKATLAQIEELFIDATERLHQRPQDDKEQRKKYSGKKKQHTVKNTVITSAQRVILFLGYTVFGSLLGWWTALVSVPPVPSTRWWRARANRTRPQYRPGRWYPPARARNQPIVWRLGGQLLGRRYDRPGDLLLPVPDPDQQVVGEGHPQRHTAHLAAATHPHLLDAIAAASLGVG